MTCVGVYRWSDHVLCIRTTAIQTVQCPRADTCGTEGAPPSGAAAKLTARAIRAMQSSRRLEREAGRNVEVMWLLGRLAPDHKTIADFRKDNGLALRKV